MINTKAGEIMRLSTDVARDKFAVASLMYSQLKDPEIPPHLFYYLGFSIVWLLDLAIESVSKSSSEAYNKLREDTWHTMLKNEYDYDSCYKRYLQSLAWDKKKTEVLERDNYRCVVCNSNSPLEVHHRTYDNIGREHISDLYTLCGACHNEHHKKDPIPNENKDFPIPSSNTSEDPLGEMPVEHIPV
ncbi:MAG: hypothetical protein OXI67_13375 [Candidatus Poribacteria bacterium]|nr:hypothetical protein [Candidatus Poribacteria bacterium]